jgi:hypothetical protein
MWFTEGLCLNRRPLFCNFKKKKGRVVEKYCSKNLLNIFLWATAFSSLLITPISYAQDRLGTLVTKTVNVTVNTEALVEWKKDIFETDEIWVIKDIQFFFNSLRTSGISQEMYKQLLNRLRATMSDNEFVKVAPFYPLNRTQGFLFLPLEIKNQLPMRVLQTAYTNLLETKHAPPFLSFSTIVEASAFFEQYGLQGQALENTLNRVFDINGTHYFFFTQDTWSKVTDKLKMKLINLHAGDSVDPQQGLQVDLIFTNSDDIAGIADRYSGERNPKILERYLRLLLAQSQTGEVTIPLSKILHPFIRKNINTYTSCSGPNCFNSGISVNEGHAYEQRYIRDEAAFLDIVFRKYRFVNPTEELQAGDLLMYKNSNGHLVHVSTYITNDIVYTKNGFSKLTPYLFQLRSKNEEGYFPDGKYQLTVFRIAKQGESVVSHSGFSTFLKLEVYFDNTIDVQGKSFISKYLSILNPKYQKFLALITPSRKKEGTRPTLWAPFCREIWIP